MQIFVSIQPNHDTLYCSVINRITNGNVDYVYYIHLSEGTNSVSITSQLNDSNYISWSRSIQHALSINNKLSFINGSIPIFDIVDLNRTARENAIAYFTLEF